MTALDRLPAPVRRWWRTPPGDLVLQRWAVASLVSQIGIVVTGGAVRLTGSGLGCPDWPHCTDGSFVATPEMGLNGAIEFGNRLLTFVLVAIAAGTLLAVFRRRRSGTPRPDLLRPAVLLVALIPAQAVIGGITVWTDLNPWVVMLHFMCSAGLIAIATVLLHRSRRPDGAAPARAPRTGPAAPVLRAAWATLGAAVVTIYLGTVVTGSGPHAGDPESPRTGLDLATTTHVHTYAVVALLLLTLATGLLARRARLGGVLRAVAVLLALELAQGVIGVVQYRLELPELLVGLHMLGAALIVVAAVNMVLVSRRPDPPMGSARDQSEVPRAQRV